MATNFGIQYPTTFHKRGPWLVTSQALDELAGILVAFGERLESARLKHIEENLAACEKRDPPASKYEIEAVRSSMKYSEPPWTHFAQAWISKDKHVKAESIPRLQQHPELVHETPRRFSTEFSRIGSSFKIEVGAYGDGLRVTVPSDALFGPEFIALLQGWADRHGPPVWQRLLTKAAWVLLPAVVLIGLLIPRHRVESDESVAIRTRATQLLSEGIDSTRVPEAVSLLLAREYAAPPRIVESSTWLAWQLFFIALFFATFVRPNAIIGIGNGISAIPRWAYWMRLVAITVPTTMFAALVWPSVQEFLRQHFGA